MKNLLIYYFSILFPLGMFYPAYLKWKEEGTATFLVVFLVFYMIYRWFTDGKRLVEKGLLKKSEFWKAFMPFYTAQFIRELYFEK